MLIDSHAHLEMREFDSDRGEVIARAQKAGVDCIITVGTNLAASRAALALAREYENVFATIGIHPHDAAGAEDEHFDEFRKLAREPKVVAYGEIGLDFFRDISPEKKQIEVFARQLDLARELGLPVVIHDREAHAETLQLLKSSGVCRGVFHCFSGDYEMAAKCLDLGLSISAPGTVTFEKAKMIHEVVRKVPLEFILLETDCPYLAPAPFRGKRNEPSFIEHTAQKVAQLKNLSWEEIAAATSQNTKKLFALDKVSSK
ncbi:MAG TPA: TatD family deoxyribonuclease [Deltaproteobacteria bacterium]|nr:TatD family deoxyribonuclease [Deltaproteobacteria bacterium]